MTPELLAAFHKTSTSAQKKSEVFETRKLLEDLEHELETQSFRPGRYNCFVVKDPKIREIFAPCFRDRIVHHLIVDPLLPLVNEQLIFDSAANRPGRGTHMAVRRLQKFMRQLDPEGFYLKCDIKSYFTSIDKNILFDLVKKRIQRQTALSAKQKSLLLHLSFRVLFHDPSKDPRFTGNSHMLATIPKDKSLFHKKGFVGLPIGSLTSQFYSNILLDELDQFCKHSLRIEHYIRYVDDIVALSKEPKQLYRWSQSIGDFLEGRLGLTLHPKKTMIQPCNKGCDFLGFVVRPHYVLMRERTIRALKRRLYFFNHLVDPRAFPRANPPAAARFGKEHGQGILQAGLPLSIGTLLMMKQVVNSYYGMFRHARSFELRRSLYLEHFHRLRDIFVPVKSFEAVELRPLRDLGREGIANYSSYSVSRERSYGRTHLT